MRGLTVLVKMQHGCRTHCSVEVEPQSVVYDVHLSLRVAGDAHTLQQPTHRLTHEEREREKNINFRLQ